MTTKILKYTLDEINSIIFQGFNYELPVETLNSISELSLQVGSPDYVKTPVFQKRENNMKVDNTQKDAAFKKKKNNKSMEIVNDDDWDALRSFQTTKIEEKVGIDIKIDTIRNYLNKLTDKNYIDIFGKIIETIDQLLAENVDSQDLFRVSTIVFEIASANRFYSKIYADVYSELITKYKMMKSIFEDNLENFTALFNTIDYVDPNENYDKFCEVNKTNEKRKSLASFYINLMNNGIISRVKIISITRNLLSQIYTLLMQDDKKNQVDELTENVSILYNKEIYEDEEEEYEQIDGYTIPEIIEKIAKSKVKDYKSLTNKTLFKFMDMIDM
jgi:L-rhamnose mutarotase